MPSVMGLLEDRERTARQRMEILKAELREAEAAWQRLVIARETVGQIPAETREHEEASGAQTDECPEPVVGAAPGSVVPVWREGLDPAVLTPDYRRIMGIVADGGAPVDCRQLAAALDLEPVPAKVEGERSKAKRLAARGWLTGKSPGMFSAVAG